MTNLSELLARWDSGDGKPYKGQLIDWSAYNGDGDAPPADMGCMCAQGQVLHLLGGWTPRRIKNVASQGVADKEVAKLLNISRAHAVLLRNVNDNADGAPSIVLTDPGKVLGSEWSKLLDFWWHLDQMTAKDWDAARAAESAAAWAASRAASRAAAWAASRAASRAAAWAASRDAWAAGAARAARAAWAAWEIQGAAIFRAAKSPFYFLSMFGFTDPSDIPARSTNYGEQP
jgi:hypothetical protein